MDVINSLLRAARAGNLKRVIDFIEDDLVDINSSNQNGLTALHSASKEGHTRVVEELIARGANVHAKTHKGNTALHIASLAGHEPVVRLLIENGADVDAQSVSGFTALYMAAQENHESIVKLLLANRANQNIATTDGFTPLAVAMQQGHEQIASFLLNNEAKGRIRFPGTTESGRSLLHIAAKKDDCAAAALLMQNNISPDITSKSGFTALHVACHYGNENIARLLIDRQADVNFQAKHNITPLHVASKWGKETLVDLLLANGARIDATTKDGLTPLHCAARSGHDTVVEDLIKRGAPISAKTRSGLAPLHMATQGDHHGSAQILLNNGAPVDDVTIDYLTALHVASHCGHVKVAKLLLNNRADPNFRALNGFTSLHIACKKNRLKVVELLLKYGASMNSVTESGLTPLHVASFMGCVNIVVYLLDNNANIEPVTVRGETPLHLATRANQIDVINVLLQYGANVSARAKESQTALHIASRLGNADIAKLLLQQGIDVDAPTKDSYTGLHIASKEGHDEVVAVLLDHGANISCATRNHGFTPLHLASKYGIDGVVDLLLSYGAPVDAQGKNGVTPLHVATHYNHPNVVQLLLMPRGHQEPGASPHAMAKNGYTALHIAAKGNRLEIANALLQAKANPSAESKAGFCPLHLAAQEGRTDMAALLLNQGAQVNCRAKNGITPLHLCAQEDHVNVAQLLVKRGAQLDAQTKGGFTPLHVASHFARIKMIMFLLANGANVNIPAASGYTPLHQASQQGNPEIVDLLLQYNAKPDALTEGGQTALSIAQNLGYVSIIDTLKVVTETVVKTTTMTITEEKFKIVAPETMQETFVSDSEDEADDQAHAESVKFLTTADVMKNFNTMTDDYHTSQSNLMGAPGAEQQQQLQQQQQLHGQQQAAARQQHDEMSQDLNYLAREAPLDGGESTFGAATSYSQLGPAREDSVLHMGSDMLEDTSERQLDAAGSQQQLAQQLDQLSPDNVDIQRPLQQAGFLVSFMVDARGGAMRGRRHSGVRVIIPPNSAQMPTRITCRYLRRERLVHPPPLMEGEACASKIMEVGPAGAKFLAPVLIEVPHFASLRGDEREIIILRSDTGDVWREHLVEADERLIDQIIASAQTSQQQQQSKQHDDYFSDQENLAISASGIDEPSGAAGSRRLTRIVTTEFPQYFAIISRIRQEDHAVGPSGSTVTSQVVPKVQAIFPQGALKKRIKIGLQNEKPSDQVNEGETSQHADGASGKQRPTSPDEGRAASPASGGSIAGHQQQRPGSAAAKRRSRFLACFGSGHGSVDALETTSDESSLSAGGAGADSPRQPCKERPVEKRYILGDVSDAESVNSVSVSPRSHTRKKRHANHLETVPDNYYLEEEPPLILNMEPKTYGKRLASSSAQTDSKLQVNGFMSITTKGPIGKKKKRGLLTKRQKHKTELTIKCNPVEPRPKRPVSPRSVMDSSAPDSSLDTVDDTERLSSAGADEEAAASGSGADEISLIQDVITSKDQKWRTCTIQTDSDSVTVNYVTTSDVACNTDPSLAGTGLDDGYVSGSGELGKQQPGGKGGLFKPLNNVASDTKKPATPQPQSEPSSKTSRAKKQAKKAQKKSKQKKQQQPDAESASSSNHEASTTVTLSTAPVAELPSSVTPEPPQQQQQPTSLTTDESIGAETDGLSTGRSVSPSSKELKQRAKQERQEQLRKAKEEKRLQKEAEEAAAKVEKAKKKLEKEKEKAKKADKSSKSSGKKSPEPQVVPAGASSGGGGKGTSVTFANDLIGAKVDPAPANLESAIEEQVTAAAASGIEHNRLERSAPAPPDTNLAASSDGAIVGKLGQEDGRDMVRVSISNEPPAPIPVAESLQETADEVASQILATAEKQVAAAAPDDDTGLSVKEPESSVSESMAAAAEQPASLKPILKQQSTSVDESGAELIMSGPPSAATAATENRTTETTELDSEKAPSKKELAKLAKARKAEAKQREDEAKKLAKEEKKKAKEAKKAAEAEAKRLAAEAKKQKETSVKSQDVDVDVDSKPQVPAESEADVVTEPKSSLAEVTENETDEPAASSSSFLDKLLGGKKKKKKKPKSKKAKKSKSAEAKQGDSEKVDESSEIKLPLTTAAAPVVEKPEILSEMYPSDPDDADGEMILEVNVPKQLLERDTNDLSQASDTIASPTTHASTTIDETLATATYGDLPSASQKRATISHDESMAGDDQEATLVNSEDVDDEEATENAVSQAHDLTEADPPVVKDLPDQQVPSPIADHAQHAEALAAPEVASEVAKSKSELKKEEKKRRELEVKLEKERKKLEKEEEKAKKLRAKEEEARLKLEQKAAAEEAKKRAKEEKEKAKNEKKEQKKRNKKQKDVAKDPAQASTSAPSDEAVTPSIVVSSGEAQVASPEADAEQLDSMTPVNTETEVERTVEEVMGEDGVLTRTTKTIETKYVTLRQEEVKQSERRDMPADEFEQLKRDEEVATAAHDTIERLADERLPPVAEIATSAKSGELAAQLEEIQSAPSCFDPDFKPNPAKELSPKKDQQRRVKLNQKLVKRALKLARAEKKHARTCAKTAEAEIAVCDEAARQAQKQLKHAAKEARRAGKEAAKWHKKMDKVDKKLAKRQKKIEKRQRKLDKRAAKLAKEEAKRREKALAKEAKEAKALERKASKKSNKSLKLEDIGDPVLKSSSRLSIGGVAATAAAAIDTTLPTTSGAADADVIVAEVRPSAAADGVEQMRSSSPVSDGMHVEMSLDDSHPPVEPQPIPEELGELLAEQVSLNISRQVREGQEPEVSVKQEPTESDEEIDVLNELPSFGERSKQLHQQAEQAE